MSSDFPHYNFRMPNIGFQNLPLNIYIVVFGTAIFVFILSLLFCCYLIRLRHQAHKEFYAYKQVILKEKVKELNLHEVKKRATGRPCQQDGQEMMIVEPGSLEMDREAGRSSTFGQETSDTAAHKCNRPESSARPGYSSSSVQCV
ncbi:RING finger protein 24 isoform X2 [Canis lupus baileyi]|uniref:Ring finger protein 24 n=1 Tax=Canis lupus familiaris TaxID=9615 RepID=A0A8C0S2K2_CANLF|nr:RING finger protein 24 isoform X2 [Canis lupus dingo]XP_038289161.1 RING finger protein 24 isoform X2 [Canis lupus familiaris]XP_038313682.1 RING finger protein 24 isoform X2 [Canis lupus familiaris]XP_038427634.1 RING finger protein 24 isoform X2 [Canis lupus familiaris]